MKKDAFRGQVVMITGASSGIGKALALQLASQEAKLIIAARRIDRLEQVAAECRSLGAEVNTVPTDVADENQCKALVETTIAAYDRLDIFIHSAGFAATALFEEFPDLSLFQRLMTVNFIGAVYCTYYALPYLKINEGRIGMISSLGGIVALPYNTPYCSSKHALHGFSDALRMELSPHKVSLTVVCPYWVATEFHAAQVNKDGQPRGEVRGKDFYTKRTMTADRCAEITLRAVYNRRREVLMGPGGLSVVFKLVAPGLLDWAVVKVVLEPAIRRARAAQDERISAL